MNLDDLLFTTYGFASFRPGQREVIEAVLEGQDVIALLPTGMGKSLCYQLPAHQLRGSVVIVSPLLSLMQDQVSQLKKMGEKSVVAINSFMKSEDKAKVWKHLSSYRFIFISPEMLTQDFVKRQLQRIQVSLLVADEAHCISQWGFDFRPDYLRIAEVIPLLGHPQVLALTATATPKVTSEIKKYLAIENPFVYQHPMDRPNISYDVRKFKTQDEKTDWLVDFVTNFEGPGIVYAGTRKKSEHLAALLTEAGLAASYYHGGMEHQDRIFVQQQFQNGELQWVCSTNAFGMGVHIANIRHVIHFQMPTSVEGYVQEVGRAGRDGEPALATLLYADGDEALVESLLIDELPTEHEIYTVHKNGIQASSLVEQGIIRETAFRVISYWLNQLGVEGTLQQIGKMQSEKLKQAAKMRGLIVGGRCIRDYLLECFNQQTDRKPANCCSFEGVDYTVYRKRILKTTPDTLTSWEARIQALMPMKNG
ncbi:RecQ family ATP-dependent DNA helicase [Planococcus salinus]|uniref:ATP-dependent DNA helicase RecQ n=1 Tax=Planococcus salinus TaxID=1848460 RepID=A0A3M8PAZ0_9BACL|nr:ATP-dependent DNA helicase RecQ [Planococcus salinus]RNF40521.1 ATP-dependent DNA helicase RecQ [Planococcus salinus]